MIDQNLLFAFVEMWHPETSSFHMLFGKMTITLDGVSCLLHIACKGAFCNLEEGFSESNAITQSIRLMGVPLAEEAKEVCVCRGPYYRLDWLKKIFVCLRAESIYDCAARAYMLLLLGCTILTDKTFTLVEAKYLPLFENLSSCGRYCWGAASLVTLYIYLRDASFYSCRQLRGYASLLQCWIHEYFPTVGKKGFLKIAGIGSPLPRAMKWMYQKGTQKVDELRAVLDGLTHADVIWCPFQDHRQHQLIDDICLYRGGLKWYDTTVLYLPERCLRQFGYRQYIL
ncbi:unnamed protein product [Lathyrus sativus]|nr:unnamed protein product [Lathyrus sativus]